MSHMARIAYLPVRVTHDIGGKDRGLRTHPAGTGWGVSLKLQGDPDGKGSG